jgi:hypothetical protein
MGGTKRQFTNLYNKFSLRFKKPINEVLNLMEQSFTNEDFINQFINIYAYLWDELKDEYSFWKLKNDELLRYGKKSRYDFPVAELFLIQKSYHALKKTRRFHSLNSPVSSIERNDLKAKLIEENLIWSQNKFKKKEEKLKLTQETNPDFIQKYMDRYFAINKNTQDAINEKLEIIREIGNYKTTATIQFLHTVNAVELNFELKQKAVSLLQKMNETVILRRKNKGKKTDYINAGYNINDSPDSLIEKLYDNMRDLESVKKFDVFISHSSRDTDELILFFKKLNSLNLHIYIDWVNDKYALKRELLNVNTANVILQRLNKSTALICYLTSTSIQSQWVIWEVGYFNGLGKPICIYNPDGIPIPIFFNIYPRLIETDSVLCVETGDKIICLHDWVAKSTVH